LSAVARAEVRAFCTAKSTSSRSQGLSTKSFAPSFIASTARATVPWPLIITTGRSGHCARTRWRSVIPSISPMYRSVTRASWGRRARASSAAGPDETYSASTPACLRSAWRTRPTEGSSSTINTDPEAACGLIGGAAEDTRKPPRIVTPPRRSLR
jgi:hypothetical protein